MSCQRTIGRLVVLQPYFQPSAWHHKPNSDEKEMALHSLRLEALEICKKRLGMTAVVICQAKAHRHHQCNQRDKELIQAEARL
jgi:hypothetical protein